MSQKKRSIDDISADNLNIRKGENSTIHPRESITPREIDKKGHFLKVITWNVNGFKALVNKNIDVLLKLVADQQPDLLFLQETKLQESQVDQFRDILEGYDSTWNCSVVKNGYAGTAVFVKKSMIRNASLDIITSNSCKKSKSKQTDLSSFFTKKVVTPSVTERECSSSISTTALKGRESNKSELPSSASSSAGHCEVVVERISKDFEDEKLSFQGEGRTITVEMNDLIVVGCYVPNSGEGLVRLDYRTKQWDPHMRQYLSKLSERKHVVYTGDLNVAHEDIDIHNPDAKHISKQAGLTPVERESHSELLRSTNFKDAFRYFYPSSRGQFTYWSQRTFARPANKGLRLDYFLCSQEMFPLEGIDVVPDALLSCCKVHVYDCYPLPDETVGVSDHCPVVLVLQIGSN